MPQMRLCTGWRTRGEFSQQSVQIRIAELLQQSDLGRGELKGYRRTDEVQEAVEPDDR